MMSQAARERHRSALVWSLIGVGVWLFTELFVSVALVFGYAIAAAALGWPENFSPGFRFLAYIVSLVAALVSVSLVRRRLLATPAPLYNSKQPPPSFSQ